MLAIKDGWATAAYSSLTTLIRGAVDRNERAITFTIDKRVQGTVSAELKKRFPGLLYQSGVTGTWELVPPDGVVGQSMFQIVFWNE